MKNQLEIHLWLGLRRLADNQASVRVEANTVGQALKALEELHPGLAQPIKEGVSLSVDGKIITQSLHQPLNSGQEIHLIPLIRGG